ncbi:MAG: amino acid ABC transporter substrate-binding protein, partial [Xanthobacteraceae bacterium]
MRKFFALNFRTGLLIGCVIAIAVAAAAITYERYDTKTLKRTIRRDAVFCGVNTDLPGFSSRDDKGDWSGFDIDFCRAIAAAIFDDPNKVRFLPLDAKERFTELGKRKVDVLARNSTWTMSRETEYYLHFAAVSYYDGQGFMVPRANNKNSALELDGSKVCVQGETTTELNLGDYFRANNMKYEEKKFGTVDDVFKAYASGQCDVLTADVSQLYALRLKLGKPDDHVILPDVISKEPLAPVVRQKDDDWLLLVKWTLFAMINAEELGIDSKNIDQALKSKKPDVMRFVGTEGAYGEELGLTKDWAVRIIRRVGNYGEVYERNVGTGSKLGIPRG